MIDVENLAGAKIALLIIDYSESEEGEGYVVDGHGKIIGTVDTDSTISSNNRLIRI